MVFEIYKVKFPTEHNPSDFEHSKLKIDGPQTDGINNIRWEIYELKKSWNFKKFQFNDSECIKVLKIEADSAPRHK